MSPRFRILLALTAALLVVAGAAPSGAAPTVLLSDNFSGHPVGVWKDGTTHGAWNAVYNGYGSTRVKAVRGNNVLQQAPKASTTLDETHASLVKTSRTFGDFTLTVRLKTAKQLRTPTPNPWETAWVLWHYSHDTSFYYLALKTNGWELGKVDDSKKDPNGPVCEWPSYQNCVYDGAQRYLITESSPKHSVGKWYTVKITQVSNVMTFWVNGSLLGSFTDSERPYTGGSIGLYNEDARVLFDDVLVTRPETT